jgi:hypothetical protein
MPTAHVIEVMAMGGLAGLLGPARTDGIVFLVPFLVAVLGLPFASRPASA